MTKTLNTTLRLLSRLTGSECDGNLVICPKSLDIRLVAGLRGPVFRAFENESSEIPLD
jgi:hypothetical protein